MAKKVSYSFETRKHSVNGITATVLGSISCVLFAVLLGIAWQTRGNGAPWMGAAGFTGLAMAFCGLTFGFASFRDDCKYAFFSKFGTVWCAIWLIVWFLIFCFGLAA